MARRGTWKVRNGLSGGAFLISLANRSRLWCVGQLLQLRRLVDDVPGGGEGPFVEEYGAFEEAQGYVHAPIHRIVVTEDSPGGHDQAPAVVGGVRQQVRLQPEPEFAALSR